MPMSHIRKASEVPADQVNIRFHPDTRKAFSRLAKALEGSEHVRPAVLDQIQQYAHGETPCVQVGLTCMAVLTRETVTHVNATGDRNAKAALSEVIDSLAKHITLVQEPYVEVRGRGRGF